MKSLISFSGHDAPTRIVVGQFAKLPGRLPVASPPVPVPAPCVHVDGNGARMARGQCKAPCIAVVVLALVVAVQLIGGIIFLGV